MPLTPKQQRFVQEYLCDLNATQAAIRAGYSAKTARQQGDRLLSKVDIKVAIEAAQKKREKQTGITAAWVLERLQKEAEYTGEGSSHSARVSALGLCMKHLGMMVEDKPHPDRKPFDLSGVSDAELSRILAVLRPLFASGAVAVSGA